MREINYEQDIMNLDESIPFLPSQIQIIEVILKDIGKLEPQFDFEIESSMYERS